MTEEKITTKQAIEALKNRFIENIALGAPLEFMRDQMSAIGDLYIDIARLYAPYFEKEISKLDD